MGIYLTNNNNDNNYLIDLIQFNQHCAELLSWNKGNGTISINYINQLYYYHIPKQFQYIDNITNDNNQYEIIDILLPNSTKFIEDYNWIINVKNNICNLNTVDEFNITYDSCAKGYYGYITPAHNNTFNTIYSNNFKIEFDCLINLIYNFFIKYYFN